MDQDSIKPALLFIAHRVPYPPNKGDKIRNFHVLRALSQRFTVHLVSFDDEGLGETLPTELTEWCASSRCFSVRGGRVRALLRGLLGGCAVTEAHYRNSRVRRYLNRLVADHDIGVSWATSSALSPYLFALPGRRYVDFMDVDSDKWGQFAQRGQNGLGQWVYRREQRLVHELEAESICHLDGVFVVAQREKNLLDELVPNDPRVPRCGQVWVAGNGVGDGPPRPAQRIANVVFTGAMDYWPNVDAVSWFAEAVWPQVRRACPAARFIVVGSNPTAPVQALAALDGIDVTGTVPEVAPYLQNAAVMVAPLRIARGIQNKVLEGMAAGLPVVTSPEGADGIHAEHGTELLVCRDAEAWAEQVIGLLADPVAAQKMGERAVRRMAADYTWDAQLAPIIQTVCGAPVPPVQFEASA